MSKKAIALCLLAVLVVCIVIARRKQGRFSNRVVSETLIARIDSSWIPESLIASPDARRVAYVDEVGKKQLVVVDANKQKKYDGIMAGSLMFSPDSKRVAYAARLGNKWFAVADGREGNKYDGIGQGTLLFSPDSQRLTYAARIADKWFVVVDGQEGKKYHGMVTGTLIFSPDSKRVAYAAVQGDKRFVVVDGHEKNKYDGIGPGTLDFSPNSTRLAYAARVGPNGRSPIPVSELWRYRFFLVLDEKEQEGYSGLGPFCGVPTAPKRLLGYSGIILSDDQLQVVDGTDENKYDGTRAPSIILRQLSKLVSVSGGLNRWHLALDREVGEKCDHQAARTPIFSPDSKRVAYAARVGTNQHAVVVDGKEGKPYDGIVRHTLLFSPDSNRVAYAAERGNKPSVVVNGTEGKKYKHIQMGSLIFSADSKRLAYVAGTGSRAVVVVDEKEGKRYPGGRSVTAPIFSPDSKRMAYVAQTLRRMPNGEWRQTSFVVVDGKEEKKYSIAPGCPPIFSPDSKRLAYAAEVGGRNPKWFVVVDGEEGRRHDSWLEGKGGERYHVTHSRRFAFLLGTIVFDSPDRLHYLAQKRTRIYLVEETIK